MGIVKKSKYYLYPFKLAVANCFVFRSRFSLNHSYTWELYTPFIPAMNNALACVVLFVVTNIASSNVSGLLLKVMNAHISFFIYCLIYDSILLLIY